MPVQRVRFAHNSGGIFEDKLQKGRTGRVTEKDSWSRKHRP